MQKISKMRHFERGLSKNQKEVLTLNPVPFNGSYQKQKGSRLVTSHSSDYKTKFDDVR